LESHPAVGANRSLLALVLLAPLLIMISAVIFALSRRLRSWRTCASASMGAVWTLKFRTMWTANPQVRVHAAPIEYIVDDTGIDYKSAEDPRVTSPFARFCRKFSIDELPQLVNVLRGEMSFVGPRPLTDFELKAYYGCDAAETLSKDPVSLDMAGDGPQQADV